ncbi:MAG: hypothetical protein DRR19_23215 [Candidatus Parabeggiatoa sp. nov. 1]|nr:MAG: hypothetical protein DRR19_23215 [Gammaproteobacteria bacterium]
MMTLDKALDTVMQLSLEQREMLINIVQHRDIENRRREMATEAREAIADFHAGKLKPQSTQEIITTLRQSLNEVTGT